MKKLLTVAFMMLITASVFAKIDLDTTTPNVNYRGACEHVGVMKFVVANDTDYQQIGTVGITNDILVRVTLTNGAKLCHDLDMDGDDTVHSWVDLETDGIFWQRGDVRAFGIAGSSSFYVLVKRSPYNYNPGSGSAGLLPDGRYQAWFAVGNRSTLGGTDDWDSHVLCVNFSQSTIALDSFWKVATTDFTQPDTTTDSVVTVNPTPGTALGQSYNPPDPALAYTVEGSAVNFTVDHHYDKCSLSTDDVLLCQCYVFTEGQSQAQGTYDCYDLYRLGTLNLYTNAGDVDQDGNDDICRVFLTEAEAGMLPQDSTITMTVVDAAGNPLSTVAATDGVYLNSASLTVNGTPATTLTLGAATPGTAVDLTALDKYSDMNNPAGFVPTDGICDMDGKDSCQDNYNLYESFSWTVTNPSTTNAAQINVGDVTMGRYTAAGAVTAYVKISWSPFPCGTGNSVILTDYPLNFVACPDQSVLPPEYYPAYEYFTYFPAVNSQWWAGLAVTNVTYFSDNFLEYGTDQDANVVLYLITDQGDVYMYNAGTLPKSGILVTLLSDPTFVPTAVDPNGPTWNGSHPFWVIAEATPTVANTDMAIDGFGMLGDGNQGQGTLPRIDLWNIFGDNVFQKK